METAIRVVVTSILLGSIYWIWTVRIDVNGTLSKVVPFISLKKEARLDIDVRQIMGAQFRGQPCLLFYVLRFVNTSGENLTLKEIMLRVKGPLGKHDVDSTVIPTGHVDFRGEKWESILVLFPSKNTQLSLRNWNNLRPILNEYKVLSPGQVQSGSAAFVLDGMTVDEFKQIKAVEIVAKDFAGNEVSKQLELEPELLNQAEESFVVDREFVESGQGRTQK